MRVASNHFLLATASHIGNRESNQDFFAYIEEPSTQSICIMVADGLGGYPGGEIISQVLLNEIKNIFPFYSNYFKQDGLSATESLIQEACYTLRQTIREKFGALDAHTTLALAWVDSDKWVSCHVGDSRIYLIETNKIIWRTKDDSPVETLYLEGKISESAMYTHPMQNILLKTINTQIAPDLTITLHPKLEHSQAIIACTDGFWGNLNHTELTTLAQYNSIPSTLDNKITQLTKNHSHLDNLSAIILRFK